MSFRILIQFTYIQSRPTPKISAF